MNIIEGFKVAAENILANKLRSVLTMLGIIIGIASVIAIVSIGQGGKSYITGQFEKIGVNILEVRVNGKDVRENDYITLNDISNIKSKIPDVKAAAPVVNRQGILKNERVVKDTIIMGTTGDYASIFSVEMLYGRFMNDKDVLVGKNVIVIDGTTARKLFGYTDCVGKTVKVGGSLSQTTAVVIGVMKSEVEFIAGFAGDEFPAFIYAPVTFLKKMFQDNFTITQMNIGVHDYSNSDSAANSIIRLLERAHHNSGKYSAQNLMKQLDRVNDILDKFTMIISAIAAISLFVGGIGVMNIMLVSVSERTREIGIRKALGATRRHILTQFLTESVIISLIGGMIGLAIGYAAGSVVGSVIGLMSRVPPWIVLLVFGLTTMVGIFFGAYPASIASKLDPIEALRHE